VKQKKSMKRSLMSDKAKMFAGFKKGLLERLPRIRGKYRENFPIAPTTWFQVGGPCEVFYKPADAEDLGFFLKNKSKDVPYTTIGVASNLLVRDRGVPGVTIRLGKGFTNIALHEEYLDVGAAVLDRTVAILAGEESIKGLEFLSGIPGTIGGALRMNAGCYGTEIRDVLVAAFALDPKGVLHKLTLEDLGFSYRHCSLPPNWIFLGARLHAKKGNKDAILDRLAQISKEREEAQPVRSRTGGSTFANPPEKRAWELIDQAGCRGLKIGSAQVSEQHCNFLINTGNATAQDLEELGETVCRRVFENSGISLRWEIQRIGLPLARKVQQKAA
jgi:UDP-N-acetylmuramate dehydrogenase